MPTDTDKGELQRAIDLLSDTTAPVFVPAVEHQSVVRGSAAWHVRWNDRAAVREQANNIRHP